jgi:hypothetical protein
MVLEGLDEFLSMVMTVVMGWEELILHIVELDGVLESSEHSL